MKCPNCSNIELEINNTSFTCLKCGYLTLTEYIPENKNKIEESFPELIKSLCIEKYNKLWYPMVFNWPDVGVLFPDGTDKLNWQWTVIPCVSIPEEERSKFPQNYKTKTSYKDTVRFGKNFMLAVNFLYSLKAKK